MTRHLCWLALLGSATVPDWASACYFRQYWAPPPCVVAPPAYYYPPPVVCVPVYPVPQAPPQIYQAIPQTPPQVYPAIPQAQAVPVPMQQPRDRVEPTVTEVTPPAVKNLNRSTSDNAVVAPAPIPAVPMVAPTPAPAVPTVAPMPTVSLPDPPAAKPAEPLPSKTNEPMPMVPADPFISRPVEPLPMKSPDVPPLTLPGAPEPAVPAPAPAPGPKDSIPPVVPKLPDSPQVKPTGVSTDPLPPLVLPPDASPTPTGSTSKYSPPIAAPKPGLQVKVFVASGSAGPPGLRKIGFYNHTDSDIRLVIEGRAVTLPRKTFIHAEVPPTFRWRYADQPAITSTVPEGAVGLDVLFRQ